MRLLLASFCTLLLLASIGCGSGGEGEPVATTEDEFAEYDKMVEEMEQQAAEDRAMEAP